MSGRDLDEAYMDSYPDPGVGILPESKAPEPTISEYIPVLATFVRIKGFEPREGPRMKVVAVDLEEKNALVIWFDADARLQKELFPFEELYEV